jgi:hypothetical protein
VRIFIEDLITLLTVPRMCRICHILTFVTFLTSDSFTFMFFHQQLSKLYCLTLFILLTSFEPFRLAERHDTHGDLHAAVHPRTIQFHIETNSDGCVREVL